MAFEKVKRRDGRDRVHREKRLRIEKLADGMVKVQMTKALVEVLSPTLDQRDIEAYRLNQPKMRVDLFVDAAAGQIAVQRAADNDESAFNVSGLSGSSGAYFTGWMPEFPFPSGGYPVEEWPADPGEVPMYVGALSARIPPKTQKQIAAERAEAARRRAIDEAQGPVTDDPADQPSAHLYADGTPMTGEDLEEADDNARRSPRTSVEILQDVVENYHGYKPQDEPSEMGVAFQRAERERAEAED